MLVHIIVHIDLSTVLYSVGARIRSDIDVHVSYYYTAFLRNNVQDSLVITYQYK
jgi:hypothetical protein